PGSARLGQAAGPDLGQAGLPRGRTVGQPAGDLPGQSGRAARPGEVGNRAGFPAGPRGAPDVGTGAGAGAVSGPASVIPRSRPPACPITATSRPRRPAAGAGTGTG